MPSLPQSGGCEIGHKTFAHLDTFERPARQDLKQGSDALSWYCVQFSTTNSLRVKMTDFDLF